MIVDKEDNIVVVGRHWSDRFPGDVRNFYLKINTDGLVTSILGYSQEDIMTVYPNPTSGEIYWDNGVQESKSYSVYDERGVKVKEGKSENRNSINLGDLSAGTYFIHFKDDKGRELNQSKIVKY